MCVQGALQTETQPRDRSGETGIATNRQKWAKKVRENTQQADGRACEPPGSPVLKTVGNAAEGDHIMCRLWMGGEVGLGAEAGRQEEKEQDRKRERGRGGRKKISQWTKMRERKANEKWHFNSGGFFWLSYYEMFVSWLVHASPGLVPGSLSLRRPVALTCLYLSSTAGDTTLPPCSALILPLQCGFLAASPPPSLICKASPWHCSFEIASHPGSHHS